jgi:flotillin
VYNRQLKKAIAAEKVQAAKALEEAYAAEESAELKRASREKASREADDIVQAEIEKRKAEISAEAEAERKRRIAKGEADAIYHKMQAQAKGINEILVKQAEGFKEIIQAADGDADAAIRMMIADKMEDIVKVQVEAIKNLKIDKVTVWDSGNANGETSTANFLSGLMKSIPPMNELFDMAGMDLPDYLGKTKENKEEVVEPEVIQPQE